MENINWRASRSLDRALVAALAGGDWLRHGQNLLITGVTGCGKTWLACALAHQPRFATPRFTLLVDDCDALTRSLARTSCTSTMALKHRPRSD